MARSAERRRGGLVLAALLAAGGCVGAVADREGRPTDERPAPTKPAPTKTEQTSERPKPVDPTGTPAPQTAAATASAPSALPLAMARLTRSQYVNAVRDVLGAAAATGFELEDDYLLGGSAAAGAREVTVARTSVRTYAQAAEVVAARAVADPTFRTRITSCVAPTGPTDGDCARAAVAEIGRRLYRRPLEAAELTRWTKVATTAAAQEGDFWKGWKWALSGLLSSPHFTHRIELGRVVGGKVVPTDLELATRLSFLLWDSTPDDALLDAAERNELSTPAGYERELDRLLAERGRLAGGLAALGTDLFELHAIEDVTKDKTRFPADSAALRVSMRGAAVRLFEEIVTSDADLLSIFDPGFAFVDKRLAPILGVNQSAPTLTKTTLSKIGPRGGILTEPAILAIHARDTLTSPTLRGRFVREALLCFPVPDAPLDVNNSLPNTANGRTRREQLADHMKNPACSGCHKLMDPIGFGLESFDAMGAVQTTDNGVPVVATGEVDGKPFDGPRALSRLVRDHERTPGCLVRGIFRHVLGGFSEGQHQGIVDALTAELRGGGNRLLPLLRRLALSDAFRGAAPPE